MNQRLKTLTFYCVVLIVFFASSCNKNTSPTNVIQGHQEKKIAKYEEEITELESEYTMMRFQITERTDDTIEIAIKFLDLTGDHWIKKNYTLLGREVHFDFFSIPLATKNISYCTLPYLLYTDEIAPKAGESLLTQDLIKDFIPISYSKDDFSKKDLNNITTTVNQLINRSYVTDDHAFGSVIHDMAGLSSYKTGSVYRIIARTSGGIEVIEE